MSGTLAADAVTFTATASNAGMITETMPDGPTLIINAGAFTVYLGTTSSVGPATGVPVEPNASLLWNTPGQLWAITDPAATSVCPIVLTARASEWTANPAVVGAAIAAEISLSGLAVATGVAVATELMATGIKTTIATKTLEAARYFTAPITVAAYDIAGYQSLFITLSPRNMGSSANVAQVIVSFYAASVASGNCVWQRTWTISSTWSMFCIPVATSFMTVEVDNNNGTANPVVISLVASTAPPVVMKAMVGGSCLMQLVNFAATGGEDSVGAVPPGYQTLHVIVNCSGTPAGSVMIFHFLDSIAPRVIGAATNKPLLASTWMEFDIAVSEDSETAISVLSPAGSSWTYMITGS